MENTNNSMIKKILKATIILTILILIIILAFLKFKNNNKKTEENNDNTLNIKEYAYLLNRIYPNSCAVENILDYNDLNNLNDDIKIEVALANLSYKTVTINEKDEFDQNYFQEITYDLVKDFTDFGIEATEVENKIKEIFGNVIVNHKSTDDVVYDKTSKVYIIPPHACGNYNNSWFQSIDKVTLENDELYIYTIAGSLINQTEEDVKICYDDNYSKVKEDSCILLSKLSNEYKTDSNDLKFDYEKYAIKNKDKFNQYKYTFVKENNNYIIKKMEKIK